MTAKTTLTWRENLTFDAVVDGFNLTIDSNYGFDAPLKSMQPKPLLLVALSGCSAMDAVSILSKQKISDYKLKMEMEGDVNEEQPHVYNTIRMTFLFTGENLPPEKVIRAVELSITKYCAVYAMLSKAAKIITKVLINNEEVWNA
jgi:putative redox protein